MRVQPGSLLSVTIKLAQHTDRSRCRKRMMRERDRFVPQKTSEIDRDATWANAIDPEGTTHSDAILTSYYLNRVDSILPGMLDDIRFDIHEREQDSGTRQRRRSRITRISK